jgi:hypothetical protein
MTASPPFIPSIELNRHFYAEVVRPILAAEFPGLAHSAALIGYGSDVLGFDTPTSIDHNWGPRLQLFLAPEDCARLRAAVDEALRNRLPATFRGYSVNFSEPDWSDGGTQWMQPVDAGPIRHLVEIATVDSFVRRCLGVDLGAELSLLDWLALPEQALLELTAGAVFHDGLGTLEPARQRFAYYPHDVWLARLAAQWRRVGQEEPFVGRCGDVGDDLGSRVVAAQLVRDQMRLAFLLERRYTPYSKWLGTAFARLDGAAELAPIVQQALTASDWPTRQEAVAQASSWLARKQNSLGIIPPVSTEITFFFKRPYRVIFAERIAEAVQQMIADPQLRRVGARIGRIDQVSDCVDFLDDTTMSDRLRTFYAAVAPAHRHPGG